MRKIIRNPLQMLSLALCLAASAFAQRTTGDIECAVTDANGAVVPGVRITVTGTTVGFSRSVQSDSQGGYRILQIPIGADKLTTAATAAPV